MSLNSIEPNCTSLLECSIGYKFNNYDYLNEALRHSSFVNEQTECLKDNERLEFLGDSVLNFIVSDIIIQNYPELHEGDLSRIRANLVNETQLSSVAKSIELGSYLYLGKGEEQTNGRNKNSILADALEAVIGALYLDGGIIPSFNFIRKLFQNLILAADTVSIAIDYKSKLQERVQILYHRVPCYSIVGEYGPDHDKLFRIRMDICGLVSYGKGNSKKVAEQVAAKNGLFLLDSNNEAPLLSSKESVEKEY